MPVNEINPVNNAINIISEPAVTEALQPGQESTPAVQLSTEQNKPASIDSVTIGNKPVNAAKKNPNQESSSLVITQSAVSHVIEEYNFKGELLLTFVDHNNNAIYKIPSVSTHKENI